MQWKNIRPGATVYHTVYTHWGKGTVLKIVGVDGLESMFERGKRRAIVQFESHKKPSRMQARELRATPNKKKIREMVEIYKRRGVHAEDGGDKLIINRPC